MENESIFKHIRNSRMFLDNVYFWTDTIKGWKKLLKPDNWRVFSTHTKVKKRETITVVGRRHKYNILAS